MKQSRTEVIWLKLIGVFLALVPCFSAAPNPPPQAPSIAHKEVWETISPLLKDRSKLGRPDENFLGRVVLATKDTETFDIRMAATYALLLSDSPGAEERLKELCKDKNQEIAGTARFALTTRNALKLDPQARLAVLSYELAKAQGRYEQLFYVNWLGCEYAKEVVPLFLSSVERTGGFFARREMYYQILLHGDELQLAAGAKILQQELDAREKALRSRPANSPSPEYLDNTDMLILRCITPGEEHGGPGAERRMTAQTGLGLLELYKQKLAAE